MATFSHVLIGLGVVCALVSLRADLVEAIVAGLFLVVGLVTRDHARGGWW